MADGELGFCCCLFFAFGAESGLIDPLPSCLSRASRGGSWGITYLYYFLYYFQYYL